MKKRLLLYSLIFFSIYSHAKEIIIEAESAKLLNGAVIVNSPLCSGGRKVGAIGDPARNGGIEANVYLESAGIYNLKIFYLNSYSSITDARNLYLSVNDGNQALINCPSTGDWNTPKFVSLPVILNQGNNKIVLNNPNYYGADIDMIIIEETHAPDNNPINIISLDKWELKINTTTGITDIFYNGEPLILQTQARFNNADEISYLQDTKNLMISEAALNDVFGVGKKITLSSVTQDDKIQLEHNYYLYTSLDYFLTDFTIVSNELIESNYMSPLITVTPNDVLQSGENKLLWTPFDNDKWIRYNLVDFGASLSGHEVTTFFNTSSRNGIIIGSVEHDTWKTGIRTSTNDNSITRLEVFGGISSYDTRDVIPHGTIKRNQIKSPKIFVGKFDDWRNGMETYANANALVAPKLPWSKGKPFAWNSWGAIQTNLSFQNATEVAQYFANTLQPQGFSNDNTVYIGLDSYWDNISYRDLIIFARDCKARGQDPGIYWTPFVDWAKNPNRVVEGTDNVLYKDIYLYADGQPQEIASAYAIDPTHPATKQRIDLYLNRFITQGYTYLKLDFLSHGALEADSHYDPDVFTGIEAYNQGLQYIIDVLDNRMFINFSISPLFPSQYAHGRRIACDAYASIGDTEYTLNSLSYGWWLDHVYSYNDADNVVLNNATNGENRARVTSSVITGLFCSGDDFSSSASAILKQKAETFLTNYEVNNVARKAKAFYPVESGAGNRAANMFMQNVGDTLYLAVFNYGNSTINATINFERIGLTASEEYTFHEIWNDTKVNYNNSWQASIPYRDVKFYKIYSTNATDIKVDEKNEGIFYPNPVKDILYVNSVYDSKISEVSFYDVSGKVIKHQNSVANSIDLKELNAGLYFLVTYLENGEKKKQKIIKQ